jgi:hypothetical protein
MLYFKIALHTLSWFSYFTANNESHVLKFYYHTVGEPNVAKGSYNYLGNPASYKYYFGILEEFLRVKWDNIIIY